MSDMNDLGDFNIADNATEDRFELLAEGWYPATITETEWKPTAAGPELLALTYEIAEDSDNYAGRKLWVRLNLKNESEQTVKIARGDLSKIGKACGLTVLNSTSQLLHIRHKIFVKIQKPKPKDIKAGYTEDKNEVKRWAAMDAPQAAQAPKATGSAAPSEKKPWE